MPTNRITMRRIRETLRLHLQAGLSYNEIARALKISKSVAGKYVPLARAAGVDWNAAQSLTDEELEARLYRPALRDRATSWPRTSPWCTRSSSAPASPCSCCGRSTPAARLGDAAHAGGMR